MLNFGLVAMYLERYDKYSYLQRKRGKLPAEVIMGCYFQRHEWRVTCISLRGVYGEVYVQ